MKGPRRDALDIDAALTRLLRPLNGTLDELLEAAIKAGLLITQDRRQRVYFLAWRLAQAGITFHDAKDAAATLGSVLCATAEDQVVFEQQLDRMWSRRSAGRKLDAVPENDTTAKGASAEAPPMGIVQKLALLSTKPMLIAALIIASIAIVGLAIWYLAAQPSPPNETSNLGSGALPNVGSNLLEQAVVDLAQRVAVALPALIAGWLAWTWWRPVTSLISREQGAAERLERFTRPDSNTLFRGTTVRLAFDTLRRAVRTESSRIDVSSSLRATVRAAGWPTIRRATHRNSLEVVLFVDREGAADHLAFLAQLLEDRLRSAGATVTRYDFRLTPTRLTQVSGRPEGAAVENVERIVARHVGQRLILIGDGHGLVDGRDIDDELRLRRLLGEFAQVHVLTPTPEDFWEHHERRLLQSGFNVAYCDRQGIEDTARISTLVDWTEPLATAIRNIPGEADPFLAHLDTEYHRYAADYPLLLPKEGAPDGPIATSGLSALQIRALVSALQAWMGSRFAFRLLVAVAVFPSVKPAYTFAIAEALNQEAQNQQPRNRESNTSNEKLDEELYARLARLPWLRDGRFPDWLRLALVRRLTEAERETMARAHIKLVAPMVVAHGNIVAQASLEIARKSLRANMDPEHPFAERLFLAMLFGEPPKADLLRPKAGAAMTERLGQQRKLAPRITGGGFFALAALCFLFKDQLVLPALATARHWTQSVGYPFLPGGTVAIVALSLSIACSLITLFWQRQADYSAATVSSSSIWARLLSAPWPLRLTMGKAGIIFGVLGLKADFVDPISLPLPVFFLALITTVRIALDRHPGWNGNLWTIPDVDELTVCDVGPPSKYALGDAIAAQLVFRPSVAATSLLLVGGYIVLVASILPSSELGKMPMVATSVMLAAPLIWIIFAAILRRSILGTWWLAAPGGARRHLVSDFFSCAMAISIAAIAFQLSAIALESFGVTAQQIISSPPRGILGAPAAVCGGLAGIYLLFSALGFRPFVKPKMQDNRIRANIAITLVTAPIAAIAAAVAATNISSTLSLVPTIIGILVVQFIASISLVPVSGISFSQRERLVLAMSQIRTQPGLTVQAAFMMILPPAALSAAYWSSLSELVWLALLLALWPMLRVFSALPFIEDLKALQPGRMRIKKPLFQWSYLDTPWWMAFPILAFSFAPWIWTALFVVASRPGWFTLMVPPICIAASVRYGTGALWPIGLALLPAAVGNLSQYGWHYGEPALIVAMLFWMRFVADAKLRAQLLSRETLSPSDLLILATAFAASMAIYPPDGGHSVLSYDPDWLVLTTAFVVGLSRMPVWKFLLLLGLLAGVRIGFDLTSLGPKELDGTLASLGVTLPPKGSEPLLLYGLPWTTASAAAVVTLLARVHLRRAMLIEDAFARSSQSYLTMISGVIFSPKTPFVLFMWAQLIWFEGYALYAKELVFVPLEVAVSRSPVIAFTGLMLGLSLNRFRDLLNHLFAAFFLAGVPWLMTRFWTPFANPGKVEGLAAMLFAAYLTFSFMGFALRAFAEGRWRYLTASSVQAAATSAMSRVSRYVSKNAARLRTASRRDETVDSDPDWRASQPSTLSEDGEAQLSSSQGTGAASELRKK
ncbi:hypothetical protein [Bradyrhizobium sp. 930_D9_N1_4]|uniref:hypothetical protein n=1 Tax=Bradyrhizobium sp. 930_D9_N1_4 TaxID=3240374 RepID=UPI003F8CE217